RLDQVRPGVADRVHDIDGVALELEVELEPGGEVAVVLHDQQARRVGHRDDAAAGAPVPQDVGDHHPLSSPWSAPADPRESWSHAQPLPTAPRSSPPAPSPTPRPRTTPAPYHAAPPRPPRAPDKTAESCA